MAAQKEQIRDELKNQLSIGRNSDLFEAVRSLFLSTSPIAHNWEHVWRDFLNALHIGITEKADMNIVVPAILLHDLGYITNPADPRGHAANGAANCYSYLAGWTETEQKKIAGCILKHKGKFPGHSGLEPESLEEPVVCDADQVDKFGWIGFMQMAFVFLERGYASNGKTDSLEKMPDFMSHLLEIEFYTKTGKMMAEGLTSIPLSSIAEQLREELSYYTF